MNAAQQRQLTPVLVAIAVLLAVLLLLLLGGVGRTAAWGATRVAAALPPAGHPASLPPPLPLPQFALVWQKPLFNPDRQPTAHAVDGGSSLGDLELTGIILTPGLRMALLHDKNGDRQVRMHEGESLPDGSVKLVEIWPRSALFDSSAGRTELKLPAGAPIDVPKAGIAEAAGSSSDQPMMQVEGAANTDEHSGAAQPAPVPASPTDQATRAAFERLRANIQKRRAAQAAAANEGVR